MQRHTIYFTGNVQGVGFRVDAQIFAEMYDVTGNVMNLPSGRVMLVAEGVPSQIGHLLTDLMNAFSGHIEKIVMTIEPDVVQECGRFEIVGLSEEEQACLDS